MQKDRTGPVAVTSGDPGGVGLELTVRAYAALGARTPFVMLADRQHVAAVAGGVPIIEIGAPEEACAAALHGLPLVHVAFGSPARQGMSNPHHFPGILHALELATAWALAGRVAGISTNPAPKSVFLGSSAPAPGHTEWLAAQTGCPLPVMLMTNAALRVATVTTHMALRAVPDQILEDRIETVIRILFRAMQSDFMIRNPCIGVTGLNPHAGESGALGVEEDRIIAPVIARLSAEGLSVLGPLPADSIFAYRHRKAFDAVLCMYHDQALIPVKTLDADDTVNVTLGLPIVRTSPGHGTALDLAGTGRAHPGPLIHSIRLAGRIGQNRQMA
ncbi:MAG: 4-hydroxythreonine-4-phosphate dehydrogenase PdxA [Rhodobacteraceae bacterium]|nr:4-hydroxythreonine-4-phosphate dehydrogenase PdxA [Paracoccaceae bacterium]